MCYTQSASAILATGCFAIAYYEYKTFRCAQYSLGLAYFGLMELLQAVQHSWLAVPEDNYAMCANPINQFLTTLGAFHICFQPLFANMVFTGIFRRVNLRDRIESELVQKLCIMMGLWMASTYFYAVWYPDNPYLAPPATEACPNYEWMREGYDFNMNWTTPNLPGKSCTFKSQSEEGHLAWVIPYFQSTYFFPTASIHLFMIIAPYICMARRPVVQGFAVLLFLTGPLLQSQLTPSLHEQPSLWCFWSVIQAAAIVAYFRWRGVHREPTPSRIEQPGGLGEEKLVYVRMLGAGGTGSDTTVTDKLLFTEDDASSDEAADAKLC